MVVAQAQNVRQLDQQVFERCVADLLREPVAYMGGERGIASQAGLGGEHLHRSGDDGSVLEGTYPKLVF